MLKRIISAIIMIAYALGMLYLGGIWSKIFVLSITLAGSIEFFRAFKKSGKNPMLLPICILFLPTLFSFFASRFEPGIIMLEQYTGSFNYYPLILMLALLAVMFLFVFRHEKYTIEDGAISLLGGIYVTLMYNFITYVRDFDAENGLIYVLFTLFGCVMCDTFALFSGMLFGKRKLCPQISPKKTIAGSIGGTLAAVIFCIIFAIVVNKLNICNTISVLSAGILGLIIAVVSQIGDLFASAIKRECGIKDFGKIIPGHGGALDRVDSYGPAFVIFYFYLVAFL